MKVLFKLAAVLLACLPLLGPIHTAGAGEVMPGGTANWVEKAQRDAEAGNADAQFKLGEMYDMGDGVPQDFAEARRWWEKAAEQGHAKAQVSLGEMYAIGRGVPQDYAEARRWYGKAAGATEEKAAGVDDLAASFADQRVPRQGNAGEFT